MTEWYLTNAELTASLAVNTQLHTAASCDFFDEHLVRYDTAVYTGRCMYNWGPFSLAKLRVCTIHNNVDMGVEE